VSAVRARRKPGTPGWQAAAAVPVDPGSLAVVRIALGVVGLLSAVRIAAYGWVGSLYAGPSHRFTYLGFGWVPQPSRVVMWGLVATLGLSSAGLALGWRTRWAALGVLVSLGWIELIDVTTYLNHYWFLTLVAALGVVAPLGAGRSLDARRRGGPQAVARGWVWVLRFQLGVVYASAGLAKLQAEWLVHALPLRLWLPARSGVPLVGGLLAAPGTAHVLSWAGALFDGAVVPLLLWRRSRPYAWAALVAFHVSTWALFPIGVFPWVMIGASTVFFEPDGPRRLVVRATARTRGRSASLLTGFSHELRVRVPTRAPSAAPARRRWLLAGAVLWVLVQVALPLRHLAYRGDERWTGQGYRFAWNVLLTEKAGSASFLVTEPATGRHWVADPTELYTPNQLRVMATEPDLIHQAARTIAAEEEARGHVVQVRVDAWVSLNGRPAQRLIDPRVDLAHVERDPWSDAWILPLRG
jgi:vitamin K-dependent gamma-carboxylase